MSILKRSRTSLIITLACTILPTLLLVYHFSSTRWETPLFRLPDMQLPVYPTGSSASDIERPIDAILPVYELPNPSPPNREPIRNNKAVYPRLQLTNPSPGVYDVAQKHLNRLESTRHLLFDGSDFNREAMKKLENYLRRAVSEETYTPPKVVLTSWHWVPCAMGPCTTGEVQWIRPLIDIMKKHDIFYLFSPWERFHEDWKLLGNELVTHIWADDEHLVWCFSDPDRCLSTEKNPTGIPPWKLFAFTFWGSKPNSHKWGSNAEPYSFNPLGPEWNLVPYQMPEKQFFLGYHYQGCQSLQYIPFERRQDKMIVLAKKSSYYYGQGHAFDPESFFVKLKNATKFDVISNAAEEGGFPVPKGLHSQGLLAQDEYDTLLSSAKALLGIGRPMISPTPFASLCRGVPVIIPYNSKVVLPHDNRTCPAQPGPDEWCGFLEDSHQHGPASLIGPPYVYTVDVNAPDEEIFKTIETAITTPIQSYEPPEMTKEAVEERLLEYFSIDWQLYAEERIKERASNKIVLPLFLQRWAQKNRDTSLLSEKKSMAIRHRSRRARNTY
ncbi:hypothetical protein CPB83DRAFT_14206 [Crepidotus variabilis]|uniref:alpha-1,6-mannosyl-glycoprotein 6-beta-N-acetylglucosaminyltransferase n=1 Tax=Crepidotus variabilis TaxID=179855 RepID=A0A9P6JWR8_9AGAR|nr:hypothetical protein CPB83DRAFT_14206 [Crepidotus variabilis]